MTPDPSTPLLVIDTPAAMRHWSAGQHAAGASVALVPTMGALHDGHLELLRVAHQHADVVACHDAGVTAVYAPTVAAMYPDGFETGVEPGATAEPLEGAGRPGHFRGVCTVVCKLLNAVRPDTAIFGQKDFQQLAVVRRMVADLDMGVHIVGVPTIREADGLAMSSRNRRL